VLFGLIVMSLPSPLLPAPVDVGSEKQLFIDDALIATMERLTLTVNRPTPTGDRTLVADKPWEALLNTFGDTVLPDGDIVRLYYPFLGHDGTFYLGYAESPDGVTFHKPDLDIVSLQNHPHTNIIAPNSDTPEALRKMFFGTCVFKDANPACPPDQRYKLINGDLDTWVFASADGLRFRALYDKPSYPPTDTNNIVFFDDRLGRYVAYLRIWDPLRKVGRCEFDDLSDFGQQTLVFEADNRDNTSLDTARFAEMDYYNSSAIKYPYGANAYFMYPSAFYHFHENTFQGLVDMQFAVSRDGIEWMRHDREPYIARRPDEKGLYMASGLVRQGDKLYLYYGVYYSPHGTAMDPRNHITRAELRLDGFVSVDAGPEPGRLVTVPLTFSGTRLELNVAGGEVRVGLLGEDGAELDGLRLEDCDSISGDHIATQVSWGGRSDLSHLAAQTVQLVFGLRDAKLYAFQFREP
jgi:hypothetical protein